MSRLRACQRGGTPLLYGVRQEPVVDLFECGTPCPATETYCGECGAKVANVVQQLIDRFDARMAEFRRLQVECRFDEANNVLAQLLASKHPELADRVAEANRLAGDFQAYRDEQLRGPKPPSRGPKRP